MSSLNQLLERRRATESAPTHACHSINPQASSLTVTTAANECWILPWHHLTAAHLTTTGGRDQLRLTFTAHEVILRGLHLDGLTEHIANIHLATVRPAPTKYTKTAEQEPFIDSVQVNAHPAARGASPSSESR